ncbi:hypothetical protein H6F88_21010 [Oculatella sp. FACHB-28]|uniref:hypothetical protein n=1 Tax=Oculatella sp. FACHB-28 TaxID=2692845 RepID=UPI0016840A4E|nr:hypothetical protein [Oculatella sp. FACHB-28]MBD2058442.1 hypothetical protein [Oculatella sp. FACHB-28]
MAIQKFPLATLQKVRQYIKNTLVLPKSEQHWTWTSSKSADELPEPNSLDALGDLFKFGGVIESQLTSPRPSGHWLVSTLNPGTALAKLPGLKLKPGFRLISYLYRAEVDGAGVVWAIPEAFGTTAQLEKPIAMAGALDQPPKPESALTDFMQAIEGDRSPQSFIIASLLRRELLEIGALGQHRNWSHHRLIDEPPAQVNWQWSTEQPKDLSPKVRLLPDQAAVEFFTCRTVAPIALFRHIDQYLPGQYKANSIDRVVAIAQR